MDQNWQKKSCPYVANTCSTLGTEVVLLHVYYFPDHHTASSNDSRLYFRPGFQTARTHTNDIGNTTTLEPQAGAQLRKLHEEQENARKIHGITGQTPESQWLKTRVVLLGDTGRGLLKYAESNNVSL
jgi:hypothetical protein